MTRRGASSLALTRDKQLPAQMSHTSLTSTVHVVKNTRHHPRHHTRIRGEVKVFHHTDGRTKTCVGTTTNKRHTPSAQEERRRRTEGIKYEGIDKASCVRNPGKTSPHCKSSNQSYSYIPHERRIYFANSGPGSFPPPFSCMKNDTERINPYLCRRRSVDTTDPQLRR